jgi:transposase
MNNKHYPEEFKIEVVKLITERGYSVAKVASRIGVSQHSLYAWLKRYSLSRLRGSNAKARQRKFVA